MYIVHDRYTPQIQEFTHALRIKNIVLRHWPKRTLGSGTIVLDKLFIYIKGQGVIDSVATRKLFKLMNMNLEDLKKEDWDGVENYYVYWQRYEMSYILTLEEVKYYIEMHSPLVGTESEWQVATAIYKPMQPVAASITDAEIIAMTKSVETEAISFTTEYHDPATGNSVPVNRLLGVALLDTSDLLFEKQITVKSKKIGARETAQQFRSFNYSQPGSILSSLILEANIEIKYRRKAVVNLVDTPISTLVNTIKLRLENINNPTGMYTSLYYNTLVSRQQQGTVSSTENSINASLKNMYEDLVPIVEDNVYIDASGGLSQRGTYVKVSGIENMKAVEFVKFFGKSLKTGYTEEEAEWYEELIAIVLAVALIAFAIFSGGAAIAAGMSQASAIFAFSSAFALVLSVGTLALTGLAYVAGEQGWHGFAAYIGKVINFLGVVSTIVGVISIYGALKVALAKQVATEALQSAGKEVTNEAIIELTSTTIKDVAISEVGLKTLFETAKTMIFGSSTLSLMDIFNKTVSAVNWVASYFMEKDMAEIQGDLTAQQEKNDEMKQQYELYKGSVDKVYYSTSDLYEGYYNPFFNDFELGTGEGPDRYFKTTGTWRCQNSLEYIYPN